MIVNASNPPHRLSRRRPPPRWLMPVLRPYRRIVRARKVCRARIFFVCGHPKSGTNWIANLINLHPQMLCKGELHLQHVRRAVLDLRGNPIYRLGRRMRPTIELHFARFVRECLVTMNRDRPGAFVLGDHSPLPLMHMLEDPTAKYVHITRDGRDVLVSHTYHLLRVRQRHWIPDGAREVYSDARARVESAPESAREQAHILLGCEPWVRELGGRWADRARIDQAALDDPEWDLKSRTLQVRYELLHADIEGQRRRLYEFLGVDPSLAMPVSAQTRTLPGLAPPGAERPENPRSLYRKGAVGDWKNYLNDKARRGYHEAAGSELIRLGYEPDDSWIRTNADVVVRPAAPGVTAA
ncbi:MAG: sulfotransferase domain-containing protein [Phycisphaerales bacterium]